MKFHISSFILKEDNMKRYIHSSISIIMTIITIFIVTAFFLSCSEDDKGACEYCIMNCACEETSKKACSDLYVGGEWFEGKSCAELGYGTENNGGDNNTPLASTLSYDGVYVYKIRKSSTYTYTIYRFFSDYSLHYKKYSSLTNIVLPAYNPSSDYLLNAEGDIIEGSYSVNNMSVAISVNSTVYNATIIPNTTYSDLEILNPETNAKNNYVFCQFASKKN